MTVEVRELRPEELEASWDLARLAFGIDGPNPMVADAPGVTRLGAFDGTGRLVGKANDLHHHQWWGGAEVAAADVGGVAVLPESRGAGTSRALLAALLAGARERGAAVSALYPTVSAVYRAAGWSPGGSVSTLDIPTALLPRHRPAPHVEVRPGTPADLAGAQDLYGAVARRRNGLLTRSGPPFAPPAADRFSGEVDGLTVVAEGGGATGFATWHRGSGYGDDSVITVVDLVAMTRAAARSLVGVLATWRNVAPTVRFRALSSGLVAAELPMEAARQHHVARWMHRPVDVVRAVAGRPWPGWVRAGATFALHDDVAPWNTGTWELEIADGAGSLTPTAAEPAMRLGAEGFGLIYTGRATPALLVEAGLAEPGDRGDPGALAALMAAPAAELLDYF